MYPSIPSVVPVFSAYMSLLWDTSSEDPPNRNICSPTTANEWSYLQKRSRRRRSDEKTADAELKSLEEEKPHNKQMINLQFWTDGRQSQLHFQQSFSLIKLQYMLFYTHSYSLISCSSQISIYLAEGRAPVVLIGIQFNDTERRKASTYCYY